MNAEDGEDVPKIGDFGIGKALANTNSMAQTKMLGTYNYMSPEIWKGEDYNQKSDIWSLGCVLLQMCTKQIPFDAKGFPGIMERVTKNDREQVPDRYSDDLQAMVDLLLKLDPTERPNIDEILSS